MPHPGFPEPFSFKNATRGEYVLKISCLGYIGQQINVLLNGDSQNLGLIKLVQDSAFLNEVVIEGRFVTLSDSRPEKSGGKETEAPAYKWRQDLLNNPKLPTSS